MATTPQGDSPDETAEVGPSPTMVGARARLSLVKSDAALSAVGDSRSEGARALELTAAAAEDAALVERFRAGDVRAFETLVRRYQRPIFFLARRYLRHDADAQDIAQRALVQAFERVRTLRKDASFRTWVYRIAINLALNAVRDRKPEAPISDELPAPPGADVDEARMDRALQAQLRAEVAALPPKQRMVVELRIFDELPFAEVAVIAGCSEDAAKVNFHHAVKRLKARMNADDNGEGV